MPRNRHASTDHSRSVEVLNALEKKTLELDPSLDPWDKQPGETERNYGLFQVYRDHGRIRSVAQIAGMSSLTYPSMTRIARYNKWAERAGRWDAEQDRITAIRLLDKREEMALKHAAAAQKLMAKALERLESLNPKDISPHALILMMSTAAQIERAALGLESMGKGGGGQTVTVAATTSTDNDGKAQMRVEVGVQHERIMATLDAMVTRMTPEQLAAGYEELTASAQETLDGINAALPATPPPQ